LLPTVAERELASAIGYGFLLGCFGIGAVLGALFIEPARARWSTDAVVSGSIAILGATTALTASAHGLSILAPLMVVGGAAWLTFISLFSALVQTMAPDWVRARVLAIFMLTFQGGLAAGSAVWGLLAERAGIPAALLVAGVSCVATALVTARFRLP